jgi:hypothetical protein
MTIRGMTFVSEHKACSPSRSVTLHHHPEAMRSLTALRPSVTPFVHSPLATLLAPFSADWVALMPAYSSGHMTNRDDFQREKSPDFDPSLVF